MACPLCKFPIQPSENYTVLVCCQVKYHAGCIHRRFVSRDRACPKCGKEPAFPYDEPPGGVPMSTTTTIGDDSFFARIKRMLTPSERDLITIDRLLEEQNISVERIAETMTKEDVLVGGLSLEVAKKHATAFNKYFKFTHSDWDRLQ